MPWQGIQAVWIFALVIFGLVLAVIYLLLPLKLWRMADRIKEMSKESYRQTLALERLYNLASAARQSEPEDTPKERIYPPISSA